VVVLSADVANELQIVDLVRQVLAVLIVKRGSAQLMVLWYLHRFLVLSLFGGTSLTTVVKLTLGAPPYAFRCLEIKLAE